MGSRLEEILFDHFLQSGSEQNAEDGKVDRKMPFQADRQNGTKGTKRWQGLNLEAYGITTSVLVQVFGHWR